MKKKNVIMLVLDSITYENVLANEGKKCPMPFIYSLMQNGINVKKVYSEAPYTEAALVSLLCGDNTLDKTGHMKRNYNHKTVLQLFEEDGYHIYSNAYQPAIYPSGQMHEFKDRYYNFPFLFSQEWDYRLKYFSELESLTEEEKNLVVDILDDNFQAWLKYFEDIEKKSPSLNMIYETLNLKDFSENKKALETEYRAFKHNKIDYAINVLKQKKDHPLAKIKDFEELNRVSDEFKNKMQKKYMKFLKKVLYKNFFLNLKNNRMSMTMIKNFIKAKEYKKVKRYFMNYLNALIDRDLLNRLKVYDKVKMVPSLYTMLNHFTKWYDKKSDNKPFFAYIHAEDNHFPEIFFTYDVEDEKLIEQEFSEANNYFKNINNKYKGSIAYDMSLNYSDNTIKRFFKTLEKKGLLEDTIIVITADHGFSYYYNPIREQFVTNFYNETYHIPFAIYKKNLKPKTLDNYYMSKDIVPTILDLAGLEIPKEMNSQSMLKFNGRNYSLIEYMGGGCPHYYRRDLMLGVRNERFSLVLSVPLDDFSKYKFVTCYDLKKDPLEKNNLIYSNINTEEIKEELNIIKKRYEEIKKEIKSKGYYDLKTKRGKNEK